VNELRDEIAEQMKPEQVALAAQHSALVQLFPPQVLL